MFKDIVAKHYQIMAATSELNRKDLIPWMSKDFRQFLNEHVDMDKVRVHYNSSADDLKKYGGNRKKHALILSIPYTAIKKGFSCYLLSKFKIEDTEITMYPGDLFIRYSNIPNYADIKFKSPKSIEEEKESLKKR